MHEWDEIMGQMEQEADPAKIGELPKKLNDRMVSEGKEKGKRRLGISPDQCARQP